MAEKARIEERGKRSSEQDNVRRRRVKPLLLLFW